ncbi:response regulator [Undibacterium sp. Ji67W]|uniref:response regulator n=1 Tax=Undibacterium sp. Ji67W TaxID=3413042 RepID=UPI003BF40FEE
MNLTLKQRMMLIILVVGIGVAGLTSFLLIQLDKVFEQSSYANENSVGSVVNLTNIRGGFNKIRIELGLHIANTDPQKTPLIEQEINNGRNEIISSIKKFETDGCLGTTCVSDEKDRDYLNQLKAAWENLNPDIDAVLEQSREQKKSNATALLLDEKINSKIEKFYTILLNETLYNIKLGNDAAAEAQKSKNHALLLGSFISVLILMSMTAICLIISNTILETLGGDPQHVSDLVGRVSTGDLRISQDLDKAAASSLLGKIKVLVQNLSDLAIQTDLIGKGDFSKQARVLSEHDRLSLSINSMTNLLRNTKQEDERRNWLKDGSSQLTTSLTGDYSIQELTNLSISILARYLNAGRGVIYLYHHEEGVLDLMGSYMYTERDHLGTRFKLGEGAIGQVARERKPIILTTVSNDAAPIVTGTTSSKPLYTYTYPLLRDDTLLGVIELANFVKFENVELELLANACGVIASFLYIAEQRDSIRQLLTKANAAEQEARQQSESLQEANAQMEEQQQQLQQQSEELRQANAQMEEQQQILEQNNQALKQSQLELDIKAKDLENSGRYKSEFLANMSHELRTPLNAIILLSKIMASNNENMLSPEDVKRAEVILRSGKDLLALINDVLDLSKIEAGHMDISYSEITVSSFTSYLQDLFSAQAEEKNLQFIVDDQLHTNFVSDPDKLAQILRNLLSNAFKFTKQGSVTLRLTRRQGSSLPICLSVIDTGIGIPKEKQGVIFEAFRQADGSTSREFGGTGLGLTISRSISNLLGGTIEIESVANQGSTFTLCLPEAPPGWVPKIKNNHILEKPLSAGLPPIVDDRLQLKEGDKLILLIDDDPAFGMALLEINRRLGYKTILAENAAQGIAMAHTYQPSGILLDLGLPDMEGTEVLEKIKSTRDLASIPIYIVSARDHSEAKNLTKSIGYLQKPANECQLIEAEAALLSFVSNDKAQSVLTISSGGINAKDIQKLLGAYSGNDKKHLQEISANTDISTVLREWIWNVVIVDLTGIDISRAEAIAIAVKQIHNGTALIFFSLNELSEEHEAVLSRYSDSIIIKTPQAESRLQQNIERFLSEVKQTPAIKNVKQAADNNAKHLAGHTILVVDDDPRNLFAVTAALEQHGAKVLCAINGKLALNMLDKNGVDLILMDIMMPEMDGFQVIAAVRSNLNLAEIPIVALTAKAMPQDKQRIIEVGANDYLSKPVDFDDLINISKKWVSFKGKK